MRQFSAMLRIVTAASPDWIGDELVAVVGIDDIQVVSVPVEWQSFQSTEAK